MILQDRIGRGIYTNYTRRDGTTNATRQPPRDCVQAILPDEANKICRIFEPSGGRKMAKLDQDDLGVYGTEQLREGNVCILHVKE